MNTKYLFILNSLLILLIGCSSPKETVDKGLTYILDMVHNNPGESPINTKYSNPEFIKQIGYNGMVPQ